ncbi:MAG: electron-transfer flavoprotein:ubiquinone oxidoreductase [Nitrospirota bacterium]
MITPKDFPPPVQQDEWIGQSTAPPSDRMEVGVLFVGAGPANLAAAISLMQQLNTMPALKEALGEIPVAIIEKGKYVGAHLMAGAILNPISLKKIFPHLTEGAFPFQVPVSKEALYFLTDQSAIRCPLPPTMKNHGNFAISLSRLGKFLGEEAEALGVMIFNETPGVRLLVENNIIRGVKTGDKSRSKTGTPLSNFQEGVEILAKVTVLGEGGSGHLTAAALSHFDVKRANPQTYSLGVKEVWEVPRPLESVIHTLGWPLHGDKKFSEFGGTFCYPMGQNKVSLGLVVGLGYKNANLSVHDLLQQVKGHPLFREILEGGERIAWGAKTLPEGGYYAIPERLALPGALIVGDGASLLNVPALKGIHYAMASGILAADTLFLALKNGQDISSIETLLGYDTALRESFIYEDLYKVRNMRQSFDSGFASGVMLSGLMTVTGGRFPGRRFETKSDKEADLFVDVTEATGSPLQAPQRGDLLRQGGLPPLPHDKASSVHLSGNKSRDDQPNHIRLETQVPDLIGQAWINMCPANVYEWGTDEQGKRVIVMHPTNCIQCGAIGAKGGLLTPPEGGSGPEYKET